MISFGLKNNRTPILWMAAFVLILGLLWWLVPVVLAAVGSRYADRPDLQCMAKVAYVLGVSPRDVHVDVSRIRPDLRGSMICTAQQGCRYPTSLVRVEYAGQVQQALGVEPDAACETVSQNLKKGLS